MELIDSHCHLDKFVKDGRLEDILKRSKDSDVRRIIAIGTDNKDWGVYYELATGNPGVIYHTLGIHPCHVDENWRDNLQLIAPYFINDCLPVAIGEIGLDNFHLPKDSSESELVQRRQEAAFRAQLELALQMDCPIVVHSRNTFHECVKLIDESGVDWRKVVFHCFAEGPDCVKILNDRGGRASFTGIITYKNAEEVRQAMLEQGLDRLIIETDAPYLSPTPHRGKENEPGYIKEIARVCAELFEISLDEFAQRVTQNTVDFFKLN